MLENWQPKEKNIIQAENSSYRSAGDFKWILPNLNLMIVLNGYSHGFSTYNKTTAKYTAFHSHFTSRDDIHCGHVVAFIFTA